MLIDTLFAVVCGKSAVYHALPQSTLSAVVCGISPYGGYRNYRKVATAVFSGKNP